MSGVAHSGALTVRDGASLANLDLAYGNLNLIDSASLSDARISGGGYLYASGGSASGLTLHSGAYATLLSNGVLFEDVSIQAGGVLTISSAASASDVEIGDGGSLLFGWYAGGMAANVLMHEGARTTPYTYQAGSALMLASVTSGWAYLDGSSAGGFAGSGNLCLRNATVSNVTHSGGMLLATNETIINNLELIGGGVSAVSGTVITDLTLTNNAYISLFSERIINGLTLNSTTYRVSKGSAISRGQVNAGGVLIISSGGSLASGSVNVNGLVYASGFASGVTISSGGELRNYSNGNLQDIVVESCGILTISGGVMTGVAQQEGAQLQLYLNSQENISGTNANGDFSISGGTAHNVIIYSNGLLSMGSGCSAMDTVVEAGGRIQLTLASSEDSTAMTGFNESGTFSVANGVANNVILHSGAYLRVSSGASAVNTVVHSGATINGFIFQADSNVAILRDGELDVSNAVIREATRVGSGHSISESIIETGGTLYLQGYGETLTIGGSGAISLEDGGIISGAVISGISGRNGGDLCVSSGGKLYGASVELYGDLYLFDTGEAYQTIVQSGGKLCLGFDDANWSYNDGHRGSRGGFAYDTVLEQGAAMFAYESGNASKVTVNSGASLTLTGGQIIDVTVTSGGFLYVSSGLASHISCIAGATINGFRLNEEQSINILEYGKFNVIGATLASYQNAALSSGFSATDLFVLSSANLNVYDGAIVDNAVISGYSGKIWVSSGGLATQTIVSGGAHLNVMLNGLATNTLVTYSGGIYLHGGVASETVLQNRGSANISSGGSMLDTMVNPGTYLSIVSGYASDVIIHSQGTMNIYSRGVAEGITLSNGGYLCVSSGGTAIVGNYQGGIVSAYNGALVKFLSGFIGEGNILIVSSNWQFARTTVESGGELRVLSGGSLTGGTVESGGYLVVNSGAMVSALTLQSGGYAELNGGVVVSALMLDAGASIGDLSNCSGQLF